MKNKSLVVITLLILAVIFVGGMYTYKNVEDKKVESVSTFDYAKEPFVRPYSVSFGENKKNIYVVEFLDPECESCALFHPIMKKMFKQYHEDIKLVIRYLANHKNSDFVIKMVEAARIQNKYNEVLEIIYEKQPVWAMHYNEKPELLWNYIKNVDGLDIEKLKEDMKDPKIDEIIKTDMQDAQNLYVRGTPAVFINGKRLNVLSASELEDLLLETMYK